MLLEIVNQVLQPILLILLPVVAGAATAWLLKAWQVKRLELNQQQFSTLTWLVSTGIWAAEQAYKSGLIPKNFREDYVVEFVQSMAKKYHISIDAQELLRFIKAAVGEEFNKNRIVVISPNVTTPPS